MGARMIRDDIKAAQVAAMKGGDKARRGTSRLMLAKIKDRDIELRTGTAPADDDGLVVEVLQKMVKQRRESISMYEQGGRQDLADVEASEIALIEDFLPAQLGEAEATAAIAALVADTGPTSLKDIGRVMAPVQDLHPIQQTGRASLRERVCSYVLISVFSVSFLKTTL